MLDLIGGALWFAFAVLVMATISYTMAFLGHPTAVWLWRDILGVL